MIDTILASVEEQALLRNHEVVARVLQHVEMPDSSAEFKIGDRVCMSDVHKMRTTVGTVIGKRPDDPPDGFRIRWDDYPGQSVFTADYLVKYEFNQYVEVPDRAKFKIGDRVRFRTALPPWDKIGTILCKCFDYYPERIFLVDWDNDLCVCRVASKYLRKVTEASTKFKIGDRRNKIVGTIISECDEHYFRVERLDMLIYGYDS